MTISQAFFDYQRHVPAGPGFHVCSPGLLSLRTTLTRRWGMTTLGCYGVRPIRLGVLPSTHSYGAADDVSYRDLGRDRMLSEVLPYLIGWSSEWGLQAIHDYVGCRIWRSDRTSDVGDACTEWWRAQKPSAGNGMGQTWATYLHLEVFPTMWADSRSEADRLPPAEQPATAEM
jgi:hypothetical protein